MYLHTHVCFISQFISKIFSVEIVKEVGVCVFSIISSKVSSLFVSISIICFSCVFRFMFSLWQL